MKITKWVDLGSQEIEIEISGQDAALAIMEDSEEWTPDQLVRRACNNFLATLQALPDSAIATQTPGVRNIIADVMETQAKRFREAKQ